MLSDASSLECRSDPSSTWSPSSRAGALARSVYRKVRCGRATRSGLAGVHEVDRQRYPPEPSARTALPPCLLPFCCRPGLSRRRAAQLDKPLGREGALPGARKAYVVLKRGGVEAVIGENG